MSKHKHIGCNEQDPPPPQPPPQPPSTPSKYHINCTKQDPPPKPPKPPCHQSCTKLKSKPFCDCEECFCKDCPDILKRLCITVTENSCHFGSKVASPDNGRCPEHDDGYIKLLDVINKDAACICKITARAVRSNVHMHMGLTKHKPKKDECDCDNLNPEAKATSSANPK